MLKGLQVQLIPIYVENERSAAKDSIFCFGLPQHNYLPETNLIAVGPLFLRETNYLGN